MRVAIYARVSTEDQCVENQIPALEEMASRNNWEIVKVYQEEVSAWKAGHQAELKQLLIDASYHRFEIVLVWALDRLTRQGIGSIMQLVNTFKQYGARIISYQEPWTNQSDPMMADLMYSIAAWVAKCESERRSERVKAGIERRKKLGLPVGRKAGAKDARPRRKLGYYQRYADRR